MRRLFFPIIISFVIILSSSGVVNAIAFDEQFFSSNDISFYNPGDATCSTTGNTSSGGVYSVDNEKPSGKYFHPGDAGFGDITNPNTYQGGNSILGIKKAIGDSRYKQIDQDVRMTKDGVPVLLHNSTPKSEGFEGPGSEKDIKDLTLDQVSNLKNKGVGITKLEDVIAYIKQSNSSIRIQVEWKPSSLITTSEISTIANLFNKYEVKAAFKTRTSSGSGIDSIGVARKHGFWSRTTENAAKGWSNDVWLKPTVDSVSYTGGLSKAVDYKNRDIFTNETLSLIDKNRSFYISAAQKSNIPWEMIAVVHFRETRLSRSNPANGQGLYQDYSKKGGPYPKGPVDDVEFQRQTDWAAEFLKSKAGSRADKLASGEESAVKYTFFAYNGLANVYKEQAKRLGFSSEEADNGEGSPYVMNKMDEKRDPDSNPNGWGQVKRDGGPIEYPANSDYGSFVLYSALKGGVNSSGCAGETLTDGGLTEDQAKKLMMNYGENRGGDSVKAMNSGTGKPGTGCDGGALSNCVSFSAFFMNKFTNLRYRGGNGHSVVKNLAAAGASTGKTPKLYSVFSNGFNTSAGHTGIILGIKGDNLIVGHASCSHKGMGRGDGTKDGGGAGFIKVGTVSKGVLLYVDDPIFAYPEDVDVQKIEEYISN